MRVYHFVKEQWGLDNLRKRRLKLARISELNDPFELLGADLRDRELRACLQRVKKQMAGWSGFLCFSSKWTSPAQWAHYADRHRGLCLGFDVRRRPKKIHYSDERPLFPTNKFLSPESFSARERDQLCYTKAECWRYEDERRLLLSFEQCQLDDPHYFVPFSKDLVLREVYVGAASTLTQDALAEAMKGLDKKTKIIKVRPAFRSFSLTRDRRWPPVWQAPYEPLSVLEE